MIVSACLRRCASRAFSRRKRSSSWRAAALGWALRPRRLGVSASRAPARHAAFATSSGGTNRAPHDATTRRVGRSPGNAPPRPESAACTLPRTAAGWLSPVLPANLRSRFAPAHPACLVDPSRTTSWPSTVIKGQAVVSPRLAQREGDRHILLRRLRKMSQSPAILLDALISLLDAHNTWRE